MAYVAVFTNRFYDRSGLEQMEITWLIEEAPRRTSQGQIFIESAGGGQRQ